MTDEFISESELNAHIKTYRKTSFDLTKYERKLAWGFTLASFVYIFISFAYYNFYDKTYGYTLVAVAIILCLITWYFVIRYIYHNDRKYLIECTILQIVSAIFLTNALCSLINLIFS